MHSPFYRKPGQTPSCLCNTRARTTKDQATRTTQTGANKLHYRKCVIQICRRAVPQNKTTGFSWRGCQRLCSWSAAGICRETNKTLALENTVQNQLFDSLSGKTVVGTWNSLNLYSTLTVYFTEKRNNKRELQQTFCTGSVRCSVCWYP